MDNPIKNAVEAPVPEKNAPDRLVKSIVGYVSTLLIIQCLIFLAFAVPAGFLGRYWLPYFVVAVVFHAFILGMLLRLKGDFIIEATGQRLDRINKANRITLLRVSTLPTLLFLILAARDFSIRFPLLALVVLVFLTDFADGYISRKEGQVTRVGRMLDSASDYCLLIVLSIVFYYFVLIPKWFFALVVARLFLQAVFMAILMLVTKRVEPKTTFMGKAAVASIMVLYAVELLKIAFALPHLLVFNVLEGIVGAIVVASMADKVMAFIRAIRAHREATSRAKSASAGTADGQNSESK